jgi:hypothetical protein
VRFCLISEGPRPHLEDQQQPAILSALQLPHLNSHSAAAAVRDSSAENFFRPADKSPGSSWCCADFQRSAAGKLKWQING